MHEKKKKKGKEEREREEVTKKRKEKKKKNPRWANREPCPRFACHVEGKSWIGSMIYMLCGNRGPRPRFRYPIFVNTFNPTLLLSLFIKITLF